MTTLRNAALRGQRARDEVAAWTAQEQRILAGLDALAAMTTGAPDLAGLVQRLAAELGAARTLTVY